MRNIFNQRKNSIFHPAVISLMIVSILLNIFLSMLVRTTDLPFYIDTVGTIVATALGGTVSGIITAFCTNAVNFFIDGESIFYAPLNMLIALVSAARFGGYAAYLKKKRRDTNGDDTSKVRSTFVDDVFYVLVLALIGGGIGAGITWYLYESPSDSPMVVAISEWLSTHVGLGVFGCHMFSTFITDFMDKSISVLISVAIIRFIPQKIKDSVHLSSWRQKPMTYEERDKASKRLRGRMSIGTRINLIIVLSTMLMTLVALIFSTVSFRENTIESLSDSASQIAYLASEAIEAEKVDEYLENGFTAPGYIKTADKLSILKNSSDDIAFLYVYKIEEDGCHVVFDLDTILSDNAFVEGDFPGTVVEFEEALLPYKEKLLAGEPIPVVRIEDEYGSFYAAYHPVYDEDGECSCYAITNVSTDIIRKRMEAFIGRIILLFIGFFALVATLSILTTRYHIVMPIVGMTVYADELIDRIGTLNEDSLEELEELDIRTHDEVEQLYRAMCRLTGDMVYQLNDNKIKSEAINKMQSALIITMADMVESRDSDTGAHVLKTAAYVRIILEGLRRNGYYAEKINDRYMRDVEMSAPLHDVGKINVPDAILNKPGRLTPEEFEIMKTHTTAGKQILEKAISTMEGDNYLKEARNMAGYHHERWDGKGYPEGLHGEVIPLSARVMAVADVFDALVSPRVYKPAMPLEKAVEIIVDGSGTQFDPKCVEVFLESLVEVKKVLKKYQEI